jgi:hypothetical protein
VQLIVQTDPDAGAELAAAIADCAARFEAELLPQDVPHLFTLEIGDAESARLLQAELLRLPGVRSAYLAPDVGDA